MKKSIWQIFTIADNNKMGPSIPSIMAKIKMLSIMLRSFENLFVSIPEGVISKKLPGLRTIALIIF